MIDLSSLYSFKIHITGPSEFPEQLVQIIPIVLYWLKLLLISIFFINDISSAKHHPQAFKASLLVHTDA